MVLKQDIKLGAYGWRHDNWRVTFYPEELPVEKCGDWRLAYYSNEFDCVLVPAFYWHSEQEVDCNDWLDDVHESFQFFVECRESMLDHVSLAELTKQLQILQPQLSALVFLDESFDHENTASQFATLICSLGVDAFSTVEGFEPVETSLRPVWKIDKLWTSSFAYIENDLSDLRLAKTLIENFTEMSKNKSELCMIVSHQQLQVINLVKFHSILQVMGH